MPDLLTLNCISCGEKLLIGSDVDRFTCSYCRMDLMVKRTAGSVTLARVVVGLGKFLDGVENTTSEQEILRLQTEIETLERKINSARPPQLINPVFAVGTPTIRYAAVEPPTRKRPSNPPPDHASPPGFLFFAALILIVVLILLGGYYVSITYGRWFFLAGLFLAVLLLTASIVYTIRENKKQKKYNLYIESTQTDEETDEAYQKYMEEIDAVNAAMKEEYNEKMVKVNLENAVKQKQYNEYIQSLNQEIENKKRELIQHINMTGS